MTTPARLIYPAAVTIPASTTEAAPYTESVAFAPGELTRIEWQVPPGPSGLMGWQVTVRGGSVLLPTGGGWVVTDGAYGVWDLQGQPDNGDFSITGYNTDIYDHTVYVRFFVVPLSQAQQSPAMIPNTALTSAGSAAAVTVPLVSVPAVTAAPLTVPAG